MKVFFSYRSRLPKRIVLFSLIQILRREGNIPDDLEIIDDFNVRVLKDKLFATLYETSLKNIDLEEWLKNFIGCCYDHYSNISDACAKDLENVAGALINRAYEHADLKEYSQVFKITKAIISTYIPLFDDSAIFVNTLRFADDAFKCLIDLIDLDIDESLRKDILTFAENGFIDAFERGSVLDIDWLKLMAFAVNSQEDEMKFLKLIDQYRLNNIYHLDDEEDKTLLWEEPLHLVRFMYERRRPKEVVKAFIESNLHDDTMRKLAIDLAIEDGNLEKAETLCRERIKIQINSKNKLEQSFEWYDVLLQIGKHCNNPEIIHEAAHILFEEHPSLELYRLLKENIDDEEWEPSRHWYIDLLFAQMEFKLLVNILVAERDEENATKLMCHLFFSEWLKFESDFFEHWPHLVEKYFDRPVWQDLKLRNSAEGAKAVAGFLYRVKEKFGDQKVYNVVSLIRACYPKRKRLMAALQEIKVI